MKVKKEFLTAAFLITLLVGAAAMAQQTERVEKSQREIEKERLLREKLERKREKPRIEEKIPKEAAPLPSEEKVLIKKIIVTGVTLVPEKEISGIVSQFENKELSVRDMQEIADLITDAYRKKGYVTSRAYIPPQKIQEATLEIRAVEGITGDTDVRGNKHFRASLLKKKIPLEKGQPFNYENLRRGLSNINRLPDRNAKAVLMPGKEPGTTDIVLEVKDRLPIHASLDWDNYGSRYIDKQRLKTTLKHNNLLGSDDILTLQRQAANAENFTLTSARYLIPVRNNLQVGFFVAKTKLRLGKEFEDLYARGKGKLYSVYAIQNLLDLEDITVNLNAGFDYKDIFNFQLFQLVSQDRLRVAKAGVDLDLTDRWGRTFVDSEMDFGIPNMLDGLNDRDGRASRAGAGGSFTKNILNILRMQKMPFKSALLLKSQVQSTPNILTAAEQFQIGGIANVRGYPPAEAVGDKGYSATGELSFPVYGNRLRAVGFYDWANARIRTPQAGERKTQTLRGAGCGMRFNLPENFSARLEFAWALDKKPSDGHREHTWFEISKSF